jgi:hypothetical protein
MDMIKAWMRDGEDKGMAIRFYAFAENPVRRGGELHFLREKWSVLKYS